MTSGRLAVGSTTANTLKQFYQVPVDAKRAAVNFNICNRASGSITVRVAIAAGAVPTDDEYVEYGEILPRGKPLERSGFMLSPGERLFVWADSSDVSVRIHGAEV